MTFAPDMHTEGCVPSLPCTMCRMVGHLRSKLGITSLSDYMRYRKRITMRPMDYGQSLTATGPREHMLQKYGIATTGDLVNYFEERESRLDNFDRMDFDRLVSVLYDLLPREHPTRPY